MKKSKQDYKDQDRYDDIGDLVIGGLLLLIIVVSIFQYISY